METAGSACFYHSVNHTRLGRSNDPEGSTVTSLHVEDSLHKYAIFGPTPESGSALVKSVRLAQIASRASSLGASSPAAAVVSMAVRRTGPVSCVTITDEMAAESALNFLSKPPFFNSIYLLNARNIYYRFR